VEAQLAIGQLVSRYALAVDGRDVDALVALFVEDVDCGRWGSGRDALGAFFRRTLVGFGRSIHLIAGHVIEMLEMDRATGVTYCRAEHEVGHEWIVQAFVYFDEYERRDGVWGFRRRRLSSWYANDITERPGGPEYVRWSHVPPGRLPADFPAWDAFWRAPDAAGSDG
jgi:hypothetical protein